MRIDLKSFLLGLILIGVLFLIIGQTKRKPYPVGRFQIASQTDFPPILLDTKSGRSWKWTWDKEKNIYGWTLFPMADSVNQKIWEAVLRTY